MEKRYIRRIVTPIIDYLPEKVRILLFKDRYNYDAFYKENQVPRTVMAPVYSLVAKLAVDIGNQIVDLGCGIGSLYDMLCTLYPGHRELYHIGIDKCKTAIESARIKYDGGYDPLFIKTDITNLPKSWVTVRANHLYNTTWAALEVLEHLEDDIAMLAQLPLGHDVIASVPTFYSWGHVRRFPNATSVEKRYSSILKDIEIFPVDRWFVFTGKIK